MFPDGLPLVLYTHQSRLCTRGTVLSLTFVCAAQYIRARNLAL